MKSKQLTITTGTFKNDSERSLALTIKNDEDMKEATELLSRANKYLDSVVDYKETKTKPLNQALKVIRAETKPIETALQAIVDDLKAKMSKYQTQLILANEAKKQAIADRIGDGKGKLQMETAVAKIEAIQTPDKKVETDSGSITFKTVKKFEVVDSLMVFITEIIDHNGGHKDYTIDHEAFNKYFIVNEQAVKESLKLGIELRGVRYWTEQEPINYRK